MKRRGQGSNGTLFNRVLRSNNHHWEIREGTISRPRHAAGKGRSFSRQFPLLPLSLAAFLVADLAGQQDSNCSAQWQLTPCG